MLAKGDKNTKTLFHKYENYRKMINIIWEVELSNGFRVRNFRKFARVSKVHFQSVFKELENENIENLMKILRIFIFLHSFPQRMNDDLEVEVNTSIFQ